MRIYVLPCDGIGPEIVNASMIVLETVNKKHKLGLTFDYDEIGFVSLKKYGTTLRDEVVEKARGYDGIILGTTSHMDYPSPDKGGRNPSAAFRVLLDMYANVRPARSRAFVEKGAKNMDLVIMREATEGFYPDRNMFKGWGEVMPTPGIALSIRKITAHACERIARRAFVLAMKRRRKVTAVHKANAFHMTDGLFLEEVRKVAKDFPEVTWNDVIVDAMAAHLVRDASRFDVVLTTNLYGDILSDLASELSGSLGLAGSMMASDNSCCAQAQHGSAPDIQGQDRANPTSMILSVAMLMQWLGDHHKVPGLNKAGTEIDTAVDEVLANPATRTRDLGGKLGCSAFGERVAAAVASA
jgi:3-isopropylmalate dehydrogenase